MKVSIKHRISYIIIFVAAFQLVNTSCSKKMQSASTSREIENKSERHAAINPAGDDGNLKIAGSVNHPSSITRSVTAEKSLVKHNASASSIVESAEKYMGVPHCMGGTTRKCMDCSGLVMTVFAEHDIQLPHNAQEQSEYGSTISSIDELKKGDLVFFTRTYNSKYHITHSGIYIGNNNFIHTSSNTGVSIGSLNQKYWKEKFVFGKRILF